MPHQNAFRHRISSSPPTTPPVIRGALQNSKEAGHDKSCHDGAQISHGLMTAENGFFGAVRQENPAAPILAPVFS
ncbi:MAG: hypothetical protein WA950_03300 [Shinella sp.]|uniref:hypothetical protein n=1 Tax=Shinella sp. TaxID=1870904 RepID=UPI003C77018D